MNWQEEYQKKLITADQAAKLVKSGNWVEYGFGINCARDFDEALARRVNELTDVKIRCDIGAYQHFTAEADPQGTHFLWNSWHVSGQDKKFIGKNLFYIRHRRHEGQEHLGTGGSTDQHRPSRLQRHAGGRSRSHEYLAQIQQNRGSRGGCQFLNGGYLCKLLNHQQEKAGSNSPPRAVS